MAGMLQKQYIYIGTDRIQVSHAVAEVLSAVNVEYYQLLRVQSTHGSRASLCFLCEVGIDTVVRRRFIVAESKKMKHCIITNILRVVHWCVINYLLIQGCRACRAAAKRTLFRAKPATRRSVRTRQAQATPGQQTRVGLNFIFPPNFRVLL